MRCKQYPATKSHEKRYNGNNTAIEFFVFFFVLYTIIIYIA